MKRYKKRLSKKKIKEYNSKHGVIEASGNNGGDLLRIYDNLDGTLSIYSGHCCVTDFQKTVPVEFVTGLLHQVLIIDGLSVNDIIDKFNWETEFKESLKKKVSRFC